MPAPRELAARFEAYGEWRKRLAGAVGDLHGWLREHDFADAHVDFKMGEILERLREDSLIVAFSPVLTRQISSSARSSSPIWERACCPLPRARTTMCPPSFFSIRRAPSIQLLPIETPQDATIRSSATTPTMGDVPLDLSDGAKR
jgi:hypothetical protein